MRVAIFFILHPMSEIRHDWVKAQVGEAYINNPPHNESNWITKALGDIRKK